MFTALLVSLSGGQSYQNVRVFQDEDIERYKIPTPFEDWTTVFSTDNKCIVAHHWQVLLVQISKERILSGPNSLKVNRLVLVNDVVYEDVKIIHQDNWQAKNIPAYFEKINGIAGQLVFTCDQGTFITHDNNCVSMVIDRPDIIDGVINSHFINGQSAHSVQKQSLKPETVQGKIN